MKKKRFLKLFSILTVFILIFSLVCISASAEGKTYNDLNSVFKGGTLLCNGDPISISISSQTWLNDSIKQPCFYNSRPLGDMYYNEFKIILPFNDTFLSSLSDSEYDFNISFSARSFGNNNLNPINPTTYNYDSVHFNNDLKAYLFNYVDESTSEVTLYSIDVSNVTSSMYDTSSCLDNFTVTASSVDLKDYDGICLIQEYEGSYQSKGRLFLGFSPSNNSPMILDTTGTVSSFLRNVTLLSDFAFDNVGTLGSFVLSNPFLLCVIGLLLVGFVVGLYLRFRK